MCMASSPLPGWLTRSVSSSTPSFLAQLGSRACSASMKAAMPPLRCDWATTCRASVVLPLDSGPKISTTRPLGMPCPPRAMSSDRLPVEMPAMRPAVSAPRGMMAPSPNCFSIWATVVFSVGWASSMAPDAVVAVAGRLGRALAGTTFFDIGSFAFVLVDVTMGKLLRSISYGKGDGPGDSIHMSTISRKGPWVEKTAVILPPRRPSGEPPSSVDASQAVAGRTGGRTP